MRSQSWSVTSRGHRSSRFYFRPCEGCGQSCVNRGGGGSKWLKIPPGVGLGGGVKFIIYVLEGGGGSGQSGNLSGYTLACQVTEFTRTSNLNNRTKGRPPQFDHVGAMLSSAMRGQMDM